MAWWSWVLIAVLIGLIVLLVVMRRRRESRSHQEPDCYLNRHEVLYKLAVCYNAAKCHMNNRKVP